MKLIQTLFVLFLVCNFAEDAHSQEYKSNEIIEVNGQRFLLHKVKIGETIFSLCKSYSIDNKDLLNNNPNLISGLKVDDFVKIPYVENQPVTIEQPLHPIDPAGFIKHTIKRRETPYFVAKKYGITIDDIYKYNPNLKKFKRGGSLRIPQWDKIADTGEVESVENPNQVNEIPKAVHGMIFHRVKPGETAYSLSKLYGCTISELYFYNPDARNMRIGMEIRIPENIQKPEEEQVLETEGEYFIHMIETGETLYGLLRKYHVPREELEELNPVLNSGFPAGVKLIIPLKYMPLQMVKPVNEDAFIQHYVQKGETLTRLSVNYNLTISEIKKYNPALVSRDGLIWGETILIPKKPDKQIALFMGVKEGDSAKPDEKFYEIEYIEELPEGCKPTMHGNFFFEPYHVGLLLPLFLEANDTLNNIPDEVDILEDKMVEIDIDADTIIQEDVVEEQVKKFYGSTENYMHFYEGVLLAVDSMKNLGMDVRLHVYDTKMDISIVDSIVHTREFLNLDLIIGPIYPKLQGPVANFAHKNRIPMVSPLSSNGDITSRNPYYYQINPNYNYLLRKTADLIADDYFNSNFIVLTMNPSTGGLENEYVELCHEKLFNSGYYNSIDDISFRKYDFKSLGSFGLSRILSKNNENVFVIPSSSEGEISEAVSNINNFASDYNVTVIGTKGFEQYHSISKEYFHNVKLKYIDPYWVDYTKKSTIEYFTKFRDTFKTEPNQFSIQGYDVSLYFLKALWNYGDNFNDCLPYLEVDLVQGGYCFEKVSGMGGYLNTGASVISYGKDFKVTRQREVGKVQYVVQE